MQCTAQLKPNADSVLAVHFGVEPPLANLAALGDGTHAAQVTLSSRKRVRAEERVTANVQLQSVLRTPLNEQAIAEPMPTVTVSHMMEWESTERGTIGTRHDEKAVKCEDVQIRKYLMVNKRRNATVHFYLPAIPEEDGATVCAAECVEDNSESLDAATASEQECGENDLEYDLPQMIKKMRFY